MRTVLFSATLLLCGAASAGAAPWSGAGGGSPPATPVADLGYGYGHGPGYGSPRYDGYGPREHRYGPRHGYGYDGPPRRRCWVRPGPWGPERICRW